MNHPALSQPVAAVTTESALWEGEMSHEDFMAVSGLAPLPPVDTSRARVPVQYREAVEALRACQNLSEAATWDKKADALAAWARIYKDDTATIEARRLKLHAYRRMALLAEELCVGWQRGNSRAEASPRRVLLDAGLAQSQVAVVRKIGGLSQKKFDEVTARPNPPTPGNLVYIDLHRSPGWARVKRAMSVLRTIASHNGPAATAHGCVAEERATARKNAIELIDWLRRFEGALAEQEKKETR